MSEEGLPPELEDGRGKRKRRDRGVLRDLRGGLRRAFAENLALKFVALVLAITLFILVNTDKDAVIGTTVGVSYTMPEDKVLVSKPVDQIRLTIQGPWRRIKRFDERELERIHIDLTGRSGGELQFSEDMIKLPPGLRLLAMNPPSMRLEFDEKAEKTVPVNVARSGTPARGYKVEEVAVSPSLVTVRGAKSVVSAISALRTREINLQGRKESFTDRVALVTPEEYVDIVGDPEVEVRIVLEEEQITRSFEVPVATRPATVAVPRDAADDFYTEPRSVTVILQGSMLLLEAISSEDVKPYVEIFSDDVVDFTPRPALVAVDLPGGEAIRYNINPVRVTLRRSD